MVSEWCVHLWSSGMATPSCVKLRWTTLTVPVYEVETDNADSASVCVCVWGGVETDNADGACVCVCGGS